MINLKITGDIYDLTDVCTMIADAQEDVELVINSPGGNVMAGMTVARAILENTTVNVTARIETMAASAAAVIALSCDKVQMTKMDILVLHHCWGINVGNKEELESELDAMKHIDAMLEEYLTKHCKDEESAELIKERMNAGDVFLSAEEAADLFDNVEVVEIPEKEGKRNCVNLGALVSKYNALLALQNKAEEEKPPAEEEEKEETVPDPKEDEPKAEGETPAETPSEGEGEEAEEAEQEAEPAPVAPVKKKKEDMYSAEIMAIYNEVL